jgi:hypothetical protein
VGRWSALLRPRHSSTWASTSLSAARAGTARVVSELVRILGKVALRTGEALRLKQLKQQSAASDIKLKSEPAIGCDANVLVKDDRSWGDRSRLRRRVDGR